MNEWRIQSAQRELREISKRYDGVREYKTAAGYVRHKCFISYHAADAEEVLRFVNNFDHVFMPRIIGLTDDDPWFENKTNDYIMDRIREQYLSNSTVTIVLIGNCTFARKFVDWEIYSSLRRDPVNRLNGLVAFELPSIAGNNTAIPDRLRDNLQTDPFLGSIGYARYYKYPRSGDSLRRTIDDAFDARTSRPDKINNRRSRRERNAPCP